MDVRNIIFDFGNVLFDLQLDKIGTELARLMGPNYEAAKTQLLQEGVFTLYETGGITTEEFVDAIRFSAGQQLAAQDVMDAWNSIFLDMPAARFEMLLHLRQQYKVFLLSNINDLHARWIDDYMVRVHGIPDFQTTYFDAVYYSHLIRLRKPDRDIYEYVLADAELTPGETVFFDDLEPNIIAAREVGILGVLHPVGMEIVEHVSKVVGEQKNK